MEVLDCDNPNKRLASNGRLAARDIVQFVPYTKFTAKSYTALAEETLRELPGQVTEYFFLKKIAPCMPQEPSSRHFEVAVAEVAPDSLPVATMTIHE